MGWACLPPDRLSEVKDYLLAFYGDVDIDWDWPSVASYLRIFQDRIPNNLVPQAPHLAIKVAGMGWGSGSPTPDELTGMNKPLTEWIPPGPLRLPPALARHPAPFSPPPTLIPPHP